MLRNSSLRLCVIPVPTIQARWNLLKFLHPDQSESLCILTPGKL
uniref:Uncharacterized protein n=1 Tax=Rhizophora mucronata TaxID=61149 RepID=A0A2P2PYN3_RHIMU